MPKPYFVYAADDTRPRLIESAFAEAKHAMEGPARPIAILDAEPWVLGSGARTDFLNRRSAQRQKLRARFGKDYQRLFPEQSVSFFPGGKKQQGVRR